MALPFRTILSPVDFDENSLAALDAAVQLARQSGARIFVLHVVAKTIAPGEPGTSPALLDKCLAEERAAQDRLRRLVRDRMLDVPYEILTRTGDPAIAIVDVEEELAADVVVIATHSGRRGLHPFTGSVAEKVVRESTCPVLTIRSDALSDLDTVGARMTSNPVAVGPETALAEVEKIMREGRFRCVPVVDAGLLVGIITDHDIREHLGDLADTKARMVMTAEVVTVAPETPIRQAGRLVLECEVTGLPVVQDERLVGIITRSDILKAFVS
jgi:acetoin utilization protein AcuB